MMSTCSLELKLALITITLILLILFNNSNSRCIEGFTSMSSEHKSLQKWANDNNALEILNQPLSNFWINSSHNTYISGPQIGGSSSSDNLLQILDAGARCIELDIHSRNNSPIVAHIGAGSGTGGIIAGMFKKAIIGGDADVYSTTTKPLEDFLKVLKENSFKETNDPLIIYLEIFDSDNETYMKKIQDGFKNYVGNVLYSATMDKFDSSNYFLNVPIKNLLGKIILIINYYNMDNKNNRDKYLFPICHGTTDEPDKGWFGIDQNQRISGINASDTIEAKPKNQLVRIYPDNKITSSNYNPDPFWAGNYNIVSLNFQYSGDNLDKNTRKFKYCSFVPQNVIMASDGKVRKPLGKYNEYPLYFNITSESELIMPNRSYYMDSYWHSSNFKYYLKMQSDGNLVIYNKKGKALWSSGTHGNPEAILSMQSDGNLVIYNKNNNAIWSSGTYGNPGAYAGLTNGTWSANCDFNIYNSQGKKIKQIY